jgi:hypothetical protein
MFLSYLFSRFLLGFAKEEMSSYKFRIMQNHPVHGEKLLYSSDRKEQAESYLLFLQNNMIRHDKNFTYYIIEAE